VLSIPFRNTYPAGVASVYQAKLGVEHQRLVAFLRNAVSTFWRESRRKEGAIVMRYHPIVS